MENRLTTRMPRLLVLSALVFLGSFMLAGCGVADAVEDTFTESKDTAPGTQMTLGERGLAIAVFQKVNEIRAREGLPLVQWDERAADAAYDHAVDMRSRGFYAHTNPDGRSPSDRLRAADVEMDVFGGENIARHNDSPDDVMNAWMNSATHRTTILAPRLTHLGVGVHTGRDGPWWVQEFFLRYEAAE